MKRDAIDFKHEKVSVLFRRLLLPTLLGTLSISAVTAIDGIFVGHGTGADGVAAVNFISGSEGQVPLTLRLNLLYEAGQGTCPFDPF